MSFQIHNPSGIAINIIELDKEACEFWKVEHDVKYYATPEPENIHSPNWFDSIGWAISRPEEYTTGWDDIKCTLWTTQARPLYQYLNDYNNMMSELATTVLFLRPYFNLIDHWESKGYIPVTIED